ncbi:MAG: hypothetical protein FJY88_05990 [Candidatus Eisenbacteria bacterium]|nr:hypothetical protein [Candidatus Eisenbacteria bacterium]
MPACWFCRAGLPYPPMASVPRESECPGCGRDLHACRNCRHHDPGVNNQCREPNADWVSDRERSNFCDFFQLAQAPGALAPRDRSAEAKRKLDDLFRKPD